MDNPNDPPCVRCRRESKECYFSATRRKRKADDDGDDGGSDDEDDYIVRNGRKKPPSAESPPLAHLDRRLYSDVPLTPGGSIGRSQPLRRPLEGVSAPGTNTLPRGRVPASESFGVDGEANTPLENFEARNVMRRELYGPHDALELLYKAATDRSVPPAVDPVPLAPPMLMMSSCARSPHKQTPDHNRLGSAGPSKPGILQHQDHVARPLPQPVGHGLYADGHAVLPDVSADQAIDPELTRGDLAADPGYAEALRAWARFRFVRAGWFTAQEAIDYVE